MAVSHSSIDHWQVPRRALTYRRATPRQTVLTRYRNIGIETAFGASAR